jgi:hypothetical protein
MTISVDRPAENRVALGQARAALEQPSARPASSSSHLASLQLLVDIAARMPLEPLPVADNVTLHQHQRQHQAVRLPPLHDILAELPIARKRSWSDAMAAPERREQVGHRPASPGAEPSPRGWPLGAKLNAKQKRPIPVWPAHASELCRGVNDCWNSFQRAHKGRSVSTAEWKAARAQLWAEYDALQSDEDARPRGMHQA